MGVPKISCAPQTGTTDADFWVSTVRGGFSFRDSVGGCRISAREIGGPAISSCLLNQYINNFKYTCRDVNCCGPIKNTQAGTFYGDLGGAVHLYASWDKVWQTCMYAEIATLVNC